MNKKDFFGSLLFVFYTVIISIFFAAIFSGSILGVFNSYRIELVLPLVLLLTSGVSIFIYILYKRNSLTICRKDIIKPSFPDNAIYLLSLLIIVVIILLPVIRWPESPAGDWFPWDAGKYHFPKAVEMYRTGSANDLTIAYGEYPFGYESLLSFCLLLTGNSALFGWLHALINLFFILSFWLLIVRYSRMRPSVLLFLVTLVSLSKHYFQYFNLWQVFHSELYTVGKNDLLLAASILSFLLYLPFPKEERFNHFIYFPSAITGMIALAVKPNAAYVIGPLWIILGIRTIWKSIKNWEKKMQVHFLCFTLSSVLLVLGMLWIGRNYLLNGEIFADYVLVAADWSIAANLNNPYLYDYIPKNAYLIIATLFAVVLLSIKKRPHFVWQAGILLLLIIGFIFTPVTAFFLRTDIPANINWRFGQTMLAYVFICLLIIFEEIFYRWIKKYDKQSVSILRIFAIALLTIFLIWSQAGVLEKKPENAFILQDQFRNEVGVDGYYSAYDYVQKNVRSSTVWVENGLPYYAYGPGYTNTVSRKSSADYIILIKTDWFGDGKKELPSYFDPETWQNYFDKVYEDPQGIVFARRIE